MIDHNARSVYEAFASAARTWPVRELLNVQPSTAAVYNIPAGSLTYGDVFEEVDALAEKYADNGYS